MKKVLSLLIILLCLNGCVHLAFGKDNVEKEVVSSAITERGKLTQQNIALAKRRDQFINNIKKIEMMIIANNAVIRYIDTKEVVKEETEKAKKQKKSKKKSKKK